MKCFFLAFISILLYSILCVPCLQSEEVAGAKQISSPSTTYVTSLQSNQTLPTNKTKTSNKTSPPTLMCRRCGYSCCGSCCFKRRGHCRRGRCRSNFVIKSNSTTTSATNSITTTSNWVFGCVVVGFIMASLLCAAVSDVLCFGKY